MLDFSSHQNCSLRWPLDKLLVHIYWMRIKVWRVFVGKWVRSKPSKDPKATKSSSFEWLERQGYTGSGSKYMINAFTICLHRTFPVEQQTNLTHLFRPWTMKIREFAKGRRIPSSRSIKVAPTDTNIPFSHGSRNKCQKASVVYTGF